MSKSKMSPFVATGSGAAADLHQYDEKKLEATADMCHYCFDIVLQELQKRNTTDRMIHKSSNKRKDATNSIVPIDEILPTLDASCPLFVTWDKKIPNKRRLSPERTEGQEYQHCYELRGCIGTLTPRPLITALREYAVLSAFRDSRFDPIRSNEVPLLRVAVSLLVCTDLF
jgi:AMMECR1 domain-containing protein